MPISNILSYLFEPWRRIKSKDMDLWMEVWKDAFDLAYFILCDKNKAMQVATKAVKALKNNQKARKHKITNLSSYQSKVSREEKRRAALRKMHLTDALELARFVYIYSNEMEQKKAREGKASLNDHDIWFVKSIIEHSLKRNSFCMAVGISSGVHTYLLEVETPDIWNHLIQAVPRRKEPWEANQEPYADYWRRLKKDLDGRFGPAIRSGNKKGYVRRQKSEQPVNLAETWLERFTPKEREEPCPAGGVRTPNDNEAELKRLHCTIHHPCYSRIIEKTKLVLPKDKIGFPEYTIPMTNDNCDRNPPSLSPQELDEVRAELQRHFNLRKSVSVSEIAITVDAQERSGDGAQLVSVGHLEIEAPEDAQLVEVWARREGEPDLFLTACLLSHADRSHKVVLEGRQAFTFNIRYDETGSGDGLYHISIDYRQKGRLRGLPQSARRPGSISLPQGQARQWAAAGTLAGLVATAAFILYLVIPWLSDGLEAGLPAVPLETGRPAPNILPPPGVSPSPNPRDLSRTSPQAKHPREAARPGSQAKSLPVPKSQRKQQLSARHAEKEIQSLLAVSQVFVRDVSIYPNEELNRYARQSQLSALQETSLFRPVSRSGLAQAYLEFVSGYRSAQGEAVRPRLVTKRGRVLWEGPSITISSETPGEEGIQEATAVGRSVVDALVADKKEEVEEMNKGKPFDK